MSTIETAAALATAYAAINAALNARHALEIQLDKNLEPEIDAADLEVRRLGAAHVLAYEAHYPVGSAERTTY